MRSHMSDMDADGVIAGAVGDRVASIACDAKMKRLCGRVGSLTCQILRCEFKV